MQTLPYTPIARPRRSDQPEVDLTTVTVLHRAIRHDTERLALLALRVDTGESALSRGRAAALHTYLRATVREIRAHHRQEDLNLWPLIAASAGAAVDLAPLIADHSRIETLLRHAESASGALASEPGAAHAARRLAVVLAELRDQLDEHIEGEEATAFAMLRRHVSVPDYRQYERRVIRSIAVGRLPFLLPWAVRHATPAELERLRTGGLPLRPLSAVIRRRYFALERSVFEAG